MSRNEVQKYENKWSPIVTAVSSPYHPVHYRPVHYCPARYRPVHYSPVHYSPLKVVLDAKFDNM